MDSKAMVAAAFASVFAVVAIGTVAGASASGNAWAWGLNSDGELGNGSATRYSGLSTPGQVVNLSQVVSVAGGDDHSLALRSDGTVWAWGNNGWGQLGNGTYTRSLTPTQVSGLTNVKAIAAGPAAKPAFETDGP